MKSFEALNHYAPALTLLVLIGGLIWTTATRNAQFDQVRTELMTLTTQMAAVQESTRAVQETLPHMFSCMIDLYSRLEYAMGDVAFDTLPPATRRNPTTQRDPASCDQARERTTPQGD